MKHLLSRLRRYALSGVLTSVLLIGVSEARAQCGIDIQPSPLVLVSLDFYDSITGVFLFTQPGRGVLTALSPFPNCVQLAYAYNAVRPNALLAVAAPIQYLQFWLSQYLVGDDLGGGILFYPWVAPGELTVAGIDVTSGVPFQGTTAVVLTVFQVFI